MAPAPGAPVVSPTPEAAPRFERPPLWGYALPASLAFLVVFYVVPLAALTPLAVERLAPLGTPPTAGAVLVLLLVLAGCWVVPWLATAPEESSALAEELPGRWWVRLQRRTGISSWDPPGLVLCLAGAVTAAALGGLLLLPAFAACALGLVGAIRTGSTAPWPLRHGSRTVTVPPPPTPSTDAARQEVTLEWDYLRPGEHAVIHNRVTLHVAPEDVRSAAVANPFNDDVPADQLANVVSLLVERGVTFEVRELARYLLAQTARHDLGVYEEVDNVLRMVQTVVEYRTDEETKEREYWRWPLETLWERQGDCDCTSVLAAAVLRAVFLLTPGAEPRDVLLLVSERERHMALAVEGPPGLPPGYLQVDGRSYFFCETTAEGARVGVVPPGVDVDSYTRVRLDDHPRGAHSHAN